ncbi:MAG: pentapeptide repeat-containing protein [Myxococcales bacterium]|nr:pentapeptide repeat-containing protein [Myxococcales bacterium]
MLMPRPPKGAARELPQGHKPRPLLALLRELTCAGSAPQVIVVTADFGHGKSLSARRLASALAHEFLTSPTASPALARPVYVRCADDFPAEHVDVKATVRRAWKRTADATGFSAALGDAGFAWPESNERFLVLLDGLDEVSLGHQQQRTLFQTLQDHTTAQHRFIVLSRPGAVLPSPELGDRVAEVQVQRFAALQIEDWLTRWNTASSDGADRGAAATPPLSLAELQRRGVADLAATPILLFMLAFTWAQYADQQEELSKATLYEHFFRQLARGKAEGDQDVHKPIRDASARLLEALRSQDLLPEGSTSIDAMLWLMARVAWEAYKLEQQQREFDSHNVEQLLRDTFGREVPKESLELIRLGLVLALQADLRASNHTILFGHKSFREFLVGYYWASQLRRMVRSREKDWGDLATKWLLGARLLGRQDQSFAFLMQLINRSVAQDKGLEWTDTDRSALVRWAEDTFNDERQQFSGAGGSRDDASLRHDQRAVLREAALAIGSLAKDSPGIKAKDEFTLRSLLAWFWLRSESVILLAPTSHLRDADLQNANLQYANLQHADLQSANLPNAHLQYANLQHADLQSANLSGAHLQNADLQHAHLQYADLQSANLSGAHLQYADLQSANLSGAHLQYADLQHANLLRANLNRVDLTYFDLQHANLQHANLQHAELVHAKLQYAKLAHANLVGARLVHAKFQYADLQYADVSDAHLQYVNLQDANLQFARVANARFTYADLSGADLCYLDLREAHLAGVILHRERTPTDPPGPELISAIFDETTLWPEGFTVPTLPTEPTPD